MDWELIYDWYSQIIGMVNCVCILILWKVNSVDSYGETEQAITFDTFLNQ